MVLAVLSASYCEEKVASAQGEEGGERVVLRLPAALAPIKVAVLPLVKKDGLPEKAQQVMRQLKFSLRCFYEDKDTIGRRYRRQDAIGTPYCVTIDHQTLQDDTVTVRHRDTMHQERMPIAGLESHLAEACSINTLLKKI
ncbi:MAG: hypothetical protein KatS3mg032_0873 [Cyclobacteriaceae bacterium]|nr:MAG: hypothetical protein KatS3mg032_0873 [Cyclobacteriaceae bacterium]